MKKYEGYSLVELIVAIGIFGLISSSVLFFSINIFSTIYDFQMKVSADAIRNNVFEQISTLKSISWSNILENVKDSPMHIVEDGSKYNIADGNYTSGNLSYSFTISNVSRDSSGNIVETGGTDDPHSKKVNLNFSWVNKLGVTQNYITYFYVNDWNTYKWVQTTDNEFNNGTNNDTVVTNNSGGEVQLGSVIYSDWCKPQNSDYSFDLPGQGVANTISSQPSIAFLGTGNNSSGLSFIKADVTHTSVPTVSIDGTFDGYKVNDSWGEDNYAYLATDTNAKEVVIIDISSSPYSEVGFFDAPGSADATSVTISGNVGFVGVGTNIFMFDLSSKLGERPQIGSAIPIGGIVNYIFAFSSYLYVANASTSQLKIIDFSNPTTASIVGFATVNGAEATGVFASENRVYLSTLANSTKNEFFIIDTTVKTGSRNTIGSADTSGMSPRNVTLVDSDRVIVVGHGGIEYQVFNTANESSPILCGQLNIDTGVNDSSGVTLANGDTFSYIVTGDSTGELKIIKGGAGGGGLDGVGYSSNGYYTSQVFDSTVVNPSFHYISWEEVVPADTQLRFQVRSNSTNDLSTSLFTGPDGTNSTFYSTNLGSVINSLISSKRYFQYRAFFISDTISTPILKSTTLNYGK